MGLMIPIALSLERCFDRFSVLAVQAFVSRENCKASKIMSAVGYQRVLRYMYGLWRLSTLFVEEVGAYIDARQGPRFPSFTWFFPNSRRFLRRRKWSGSDGGGVILFGLQVGEFRPFVFNRRSPFGRNVLSIFRHADGDTLRGRLIVFLPTVLSDRIFMSSLAT